MQPLGNTWNSLEVVKLIVGILIPPSAASFVLFISHQSNKTKLIQ
jgi:hypothetical protein